MPKRVDGNQPEIVKALRNVGASVTHLHEIGRGVPDLLVGFRNQNFLIEVKDPDQPPNKRKLTEDEEEWHRTWNGQVAVIMSSVEAIDLISYLTRHSRKR